jgi:ankyrin repeat protein
LIARLLTEQPTLCDTLNENDHSFLSSIARTGNFRAVERMLDLGFRIDATADDIFAPAFIYAAQRGDVAMLKLLIDRGADLDSSHKYGGNALGTAIYAAANFPTPGGDYPGAVDLLLDSGLERSDDMLTFASEHGLSGIAKKLIDRSDR